MCGAANNFAESSLVALSHLKTLAQQSRRTWGVYAEDFSLESPWTWCSIEKWGGSMKRKACKHLTLWLIKVLSVWRMFVRNDFLKPPCCSRTMKLHVTSDKAERPLGSCSPSLPLAVCLSAVPDAVCLEIWMKRLADAEGNMLVCNRKWSVRGVSWLNCERKHRSAMLQTND